MGKIFLQPSLEYNPLNHHANIWIIICPDHIEKGDGSLNIQERRTALMSGKILVTSATRSEGE